MGFLSKQPAFNEPGKEQSASRPFIADDQTVARVNELMARFNDAAGDDSRMRAVASAISSAAGLDDLKQTFHEPWMLQRPWQMLAAAALRAAQDGDHTLAVRIFGFTSFWGTQIAPLLGPADWYELRLDKIPLAIETEIASTALGSLQQLPDDLVILGNETGSLTVAMLKFAAANTIITAQQRGVAVSDIILDAAHTVVG
jgi:hypothetical protein